MNTSDSTASPDNNNIHTENHTGSTVPCLKNNTDDPNLNSNAHGYFVPVIMLVVLGIIISATFFDKDSGMLAANVKPQDQINGLASNEKKAFYAWVGPELQAEIATDEFAVSAPASAHNDMSTVAAVSGTAANNAWSKAISADNRTLYSARQDSDAYPYAPPAPYSMLEERMHPYNEIMQARRKAYEQAMQAQNEHMQKMHAYRAAVLKRIQRNRADLYNRRQELD